MRIFTTILAVFLFINMVSAQKYLMESSTYSEGEGNDSFIVQYDYEYEEGKMVLKYESYDDWYYVDSMFYDNENRIEYIATYELDTEVIPGDAELFVYNNNMLESKVYLDYDEVDESYIQSHLETYHYENDTLKRIDGFETIGTPLLFYITFKYDAEGRLIEHIIYEDGTVDGDILASILEYNDDDYFSMLTQVYSYFEEIDTVSYEVFYQDGNPDSLVYSDEYDTIVINYTHDLEYTSDDNHFYEEELSDLFFEKIHHKNRLTYLEYSLDEVFARVDFTYIENTVKTSEHKALLPLTVYPNPTSDHFIVDVQDPQAMLNMYDVHGKLVHKQDVGLYRRVDVSALTPGTYICTIQSKGQLMSGKLVVR